MDKEAHLNAIILLLIFCGVPLLVHSSDLEYRTFRCRNGTYIGDRLICDGKKDCVDDGADEDPSFCDKYGDNKLNCGPGKFRCQIDKCANASARCNTIEDCQYGNEDEKNCGDEVDTYNCQLPKGKYLCRDGIRCLDFNLTCDGFCHCFDCSDEKTGCSDGGYTDPVSVKSSHEACFTTPKGPVCCSEIGPLCKECDSNDICDQKCVQLGNKTACFCDENYVGVPGTNNAECVPSNNAIKEKILLYSATNGIHGINLFTNTNFTVDYGNFIGYWSTALTAFQDHIYSVSYYPEPSNGIDYITNPNKKRKTLTSIFKTSITRNETHEIMKNDSSPWIINSIAVDWVTGNIYFASREAISICSNDGRICKQLKPGMASFINLVSKRGLMFWISDGILMKSSMDGSDEISMRSLQLSGSGSTDFRVEFMTVDEVSERIYWRVDTEYEAIYSASFNGDKKRVWSLDNTKPPYWLSSVYVPTSHWDASIYFEREVYFIAELRSLKRIFIVDEKTNTLVQRHPVPKQYKEDYKIRNHYEPKLLYVYNPALQRTKIPNPCPSSCTGLCLTRPSSNKGFLNYTCLYGH